MKKILLIVLLLRAAATLAQSEPVELFSSLRGASNEAIEKHDIKGMSKYWADDLVLVMGNSKHLSGKVAIVKSWIQLFHEKPNVYYIRTPLQINISSNDPLAWETGTWKAFHSYSKGGNYSAMWKKSQDSWKILAEQFVSMF